jgi:hypothetical protein
MFAIRWAARRWLPLAFLSIAALVPHLSARASERELSLPTVAPAIRGQRSFAHLTNQILALDQRPDHRNEP